MALPGWNGSVSIYRPAVVYRTGLYTAGYLQRACPPGFTNCHGVCATLNDSPHCGRCDNKCRPLQDCCNRQCEYLTLNDNCGKCGNVCRPDQACCSVDGRWFDCVDVSGPERCGACDAAP